MKRKMSSRRRRAIIRRRIVFSTFFCLIFALVALVSWKVGLFGSSKKQDPKEATVSNSQTDTGIKRKPKEEKVTTASVVSTGDIMVHSPQLSGARVSGTDTYDFSAFFKHAASYFQKFDLAVANLEVTFGGKESGAYSGYPLFNTPDSLADVIKQSGLNFLVTANNHAYDTGLFGLQRTAKILKEKGIPFIGTKETADDPTFVVKEINGIKIGIANYTYETQGTDTARKYLNGGPIAVEANDLINTFSVQHIDDFYSEAQSVIDAMKEQKADYIVFYMHWGDEYRLTANDWQRTIAQKLSNFGVNMIIGGHPHVIEPVELIRPEGGEGMTVCLYSLGNCISNQRQEIMDSCPSGHTEDGMLFSFELTKKGKDTALTGLDLIPTWVDKYPGGSGYQYTVYPLEKPENAAQKYGLTGTALTKAQKSYARTKEIVAEGLTACQKEIGCQISFE